MNYNYSFYEKSKYEEINIDRAQENKDVDLYQRTKDERILEKIFNDRKPTLQYWAVQHYFPGLAPSIEDFYGELIIVFVKALEYYKYGRGSSFNTCLYTFLLNRIKNIKAGKYAKKRKPESYEGPLSGIMLSLDYQYDEKDGSSITLKEKIENEDSLDYEKTKNNVNFEESIDILSNGNPKLKEVFMKIGNGNSISSIMRDSKIKDGEVNIDDAFVINYENNKCKSVIIDKIKEEHKLNSFKLLNFEIKGSILKYQVEMKKTKESEMISKTMRYLKKNKEQYINLFKNGDYGDFNRVEDEVEENLIA